MRAHLAVAAAFLIPLAHAYEAKLVWDEYSDARAATFRFYRNMDQTGYTFLAQIPVTQKEFILTDIREGVMGCYYMTAATVDGLESVPSNEACYTALPFSRITPQEIEITGEPGRLYTVYQSPDFTDWKEFARFVMPAGQHKYKLPVSFTEEKMFFKVVGRAQ